MPPDLLTLYRGPEIPIGWDTPIDPRCIIYEYDMDIFSIYLDMDRFASLNEDSDRIVISQLKDMINGRLQATAPTRRQSDKRRRPG